MASKLIDRLPVLARAAGWAAFALLAGSMLKGCRIDVAEPGVEAITAEELDGHLRFLASDLLEGRSPGTRGSELAALYIAGQFALAGLRVPGTKVDDPDCVAKSNPRFWEEWASMIGI